MKLQVGLKNVSILGKAEMIDNHVHVTNLHPREVGMSVGATAGLTLGILSGIGIFAIPGLGFLYGAGALVGALAGFDFGILGGAVLGVLATYGIKNEDIIEYEKHINEGKPILIINGSEDEIKEAKEILLTENNLIAIHEH